MFANTHEHSVTTVPACASHTHLLIRNRIDHAHTKVVGGEVVVVLAHVLLLHAKDHKHLELLVRWRTVLPSVSTWPAQRRTRSQKDSALTAPIWPDEQEVISGMRT